MGAAAAIGVGSLASAGASLFGSSQASKAQASAAKYAAAVQQHAYDQTRLDLTAYRDVGQNGAAQLNNRLTELTSPIIMDQAALEQTPGYQFTRTQGIKAAQNSAAARGLGISGAAIKGATDYASGLADKTYLDQFGVANTNQTNAFNRLFQTAGLGQSAATQTGMFGANAANGIASSAIQQGNAQAAGAMAGANAIGNGANSLAQYYAMAPLYNKLLGAGGGGGSFYGSTPSLSTGSISDWV